MEKIAGGVTAAVGYEAASVAANIKYKDREDMALIFSLAPCQVAGTFTQNVVKAAPVMWDRRIVESGGPVQAVVINAGIANACTGEDGMAYCRETGEAAAEALGIEKTQVLVASTGVIGMQLPIGRICQGVGELAQSKKSGKKAGTAAARAIMTTDTREKEVAVQLEIGGKTVTVGGMCKGSGMIHPNMCTMLSFVTTDACISQAVLQRMVSSIVKDTYNMISVDGDTSTNDTLLVLANGMADNQEIQEGTEEWEAFYKALYQVNETLAKKMAGDGEGATALLEVKVLHGDTREHAMKLAKSVVTSNLVKTAVAGHDANWGRILCALGYAGVSFDPQKVNLSLESSAGKLQIIADGVAVEYSEDKATTILSQEEVTVICDMQMGEEQATAWGCDLTYDYIRINADYRS